MAKLKIKRAVSFVMATVLSLTAFMGVGANTAFAAAGEKTNVYMVDFPRDGDANYDGVWGHNNLTLKNGWHTGSATHTNLSLCPMSWVSSRNTAHTCSGFSRSLTVVIPCPTLFIGDTKSFLATRELL